ncbi:MAG: matrixin family metalloprotease [Lachnospiraceae bacterium]|nr:matrixin family metalloprotease [Lachnospiraceae bacterium]
MKRKLLQIFACLVLLCNVNCIVVSAEDGATCTHGKHTFYDHTLNGGVGNYGYNDRYYWISSSFNSTYTKRIKNAVRDWVYTTDSVGVTTPISLVNTSTKSQSVFDVYPSDLGNRILGLTQFYLHGGSSVDPEKKNWSYTKIYINTSELDNSIYGFTPIQKRATIEHEFGHAMGLSHRNTKPESIMCQSGHERTAEKPIKSDCNNINHLY